MKSRFSLRTYTALQTEAPVLGRSVEAHTDEVSLAHRFELRHNSSPRFARRRQERRQGQALLLAVLIMLLAALLSAGFLAVVSGNLNQTARIADKTRAIEASRAGIAYANTQLSGSSQGDLWRPIDVSPAPNPALPADAARYNFYYSQLDKVQGWAASAPPTRDSFALGAVGDEQFRIAVKNFRDATFGKFPDPSQIVGDAPKFLVRVQELPSSLPLNNREYEHRGEIKITSVGLSDDDPNVYHTSVAYKTGRKKSPWGLALRSVSNWRFGNSDKETGVPFARVIEARTIVTPAANVNIAVDVSNAPTFLDSEAPFNVVLIKKDTVNPANSTVRGAVVTKVDTTSGTVLTLARMNTSIEADEIVQKAAAIGTGLNIDLLNTGTPTLITATFPNYTQPNGILANGSLWLQNQVQLSNLSKTGTKMFVSGSVAIDESQQGITKPFLPRVDINDNSDIGTGVLANANRLVPSNVGYPGVNIALTPEADSNEVKQSDLVNDGWNKIGAQTLGLDYSNSRDVEPFQPVKIDSAENLARYRALTRDSTEGVYIDNRDDVEKIVDNQGPTLKAMPQAQLVRMLTSSDVNAADPYLRSSAAGGASLEERHLRGWVGPDEFLARGALVEMVQGTGNPFLRVTYDARSDANPLGPDPSKAARINGNIQNGVYVTELPWPANGMLLAEGNVRIRGDVNLPAPPTDGSRDIYPSLTVVSLNNIYIEGSVSVDKSVVGITPSPNRKKLMLLAKKNVIVNPTRAIIGRTDVQTVTFGNTNDALETVLSNGTPSDPATIDVPVVNGFAFNVGDYVTIEAQVSNLDSTFKLIRGLVKARNATQISVETTDIGAILVNQRKIVRSPMETREAGTRASAQSFYSVVDTERAFNRRIYAPLANRTLNKLLFDHVGDLRKNQASTALVGLKIKAVDHTPTTIPLPATGFTAELTDKQRLDINNAVVPNDFVTQTDKKISIYNNFNGGNKDVFNNTPTSQTLTDFASDISGFAGRVDNTDPRAPKGYKYSATLNEDAPPLVDLDINNRLASIGGLPYYALAGVGLRREHGATAGFANNGTGRKPFALDTTPITTTPVTPADTAPNVSAVVPLATSIEFDLNSTLSSLVTDTQTQNVVPYLGFHAGPNPDQNGNDLGLTSEEDTLTVDSTFYQTRDDILNNSTADQRVLNVPNPMGNLTHSIVLKRSNGFTDPLTSKLLPDYRVKALKLENFNRGNARTIRPIAQSLQINAFVYAQEGSWLVIPGDYFRANPIVRAVVTPDNSVNGDFKGSYIDFNGNKTPQPDEFIVAPNGDSCADLNRNGEPDPGEREASLRLIRYNYFPVQFFGAIVENQTAVVADVVDPVTPTNSIVKGAVQDWMDKWASYGEPPSGNIRGNENQFSLINYTYDPSIAQNSAGANQLRVPVTDELIYVQ